MRKRVYVCDGAGGAAASAGAAGVAFADASRQRQPGSVNQAVSATIADGYGQAGVQLAVMSARYGEAARTHFKASAVAPDFVFMMVKADRGYGLAKVSKTNGRLLGVIDLGRDKDPVYEADAISNLIFYRPSPGTVVGYRF